MQIEFLAFIKYFSLVQLFLIVISIFGIYTAKIIRSALVSNKKKWTQYFTQQFQNFSVNFSAQSSFNLKKLKKHIALIIPIIKQIDESTSSEYWNMAREKIVDEILLPHFIRYAKSTRWYRRYLACQMIQLTLTTHQFQLSPYLRPLQNLIKDEVLLVALHAVRIAMIANSQILMDTVIDHFAKNRRMQKTLFLQSIKINAQNITTITHRLNHENDPYTKVLCYQMLCEQPAHTLPIQSLKNDLNDLNIDLQIAALNYHTLTQPNLSLLKDKLSHSAWEVQVKTIQLIGKIQAISLAPALEPYLKNQHWWVRINAAEALLKLGDEGVFILKKQKLENDQFAYDAAEKTLLQNTWKPT